MCFCGMPLADKMMLSIYNCSQLPRATYSVFEPATKLITNPKPYCAELFNPRWVLHMNSVARH